MDTLASNFAAFIESIKGFDLASTSSATIAIAITAEPGDRLRIVWDSRAGRDYRLEIPELPALKAIESKIPREDKIFAKLIGFDPDAPAPSPLLPALSTDEILKAHGMLAPRRRKR